MFNLKNTTTDENEVIVLKLNYDGSLVWKTNHSGGKAYDITVDQNGNYVLVGTIKQSSSDYDGWMMKISSEGEIIFEKSHNKEFNQEFTSVDVDSNGNILLSGNTSNETDGYIGYAMKTDYTGDSLWSVTINNVNRVENILALPNSRILTYCPNNNPGVFRYYNSDGSLQSEQEIQNPDQAYWIIAKIKKSNTGITICFLDAMIASGPITLNHYDFEGNFLSSSNYEGYPSDFNDFTLTDDNGTVVTGSAYNDVGETTFLLKTTESGEIDWYSELE